MSTRRHHTQQEREHWLTQFAQTDTTASAFCRQHDLGYQSFLNWRKAACEVNKPPAIDFIEIDVPPPKAIPPSGEQIELTFPSGLTLRIQSHTSTQP